MKKHNFYAGPSILSEYTIKNTADAVMNFNETGLSILEISHRSKEFQAVIDEANALIKELLEIPSGYEVLFLGGGASMQFCMIPYNFLKTKAAYLDTGVWASKAIKEAKLFGDVNVVASSKDANYTFVPKGYTVPDDVDYFHITTNNTIYGTELREDPDVKVPLIADMSSDIFSRRIDVSKYDAIDNSKIFVGTAKPEDRSIMNVCFVLRPEYAELDKKFLEFTGERGIVGIKGHRSVGGFRASIYNAMPMESVQVLIDAMKDFEKQL